MLEGSSVATALRAKGIPVGKGRAKPDVPASRRRLIERWATKFAKKHVYSRSARYAVSKFGEPAATWVSHIDDVGFQALTALREDRSLRPYRKKFSVVHKVLHQFPDWVVHPISNILGHWARTLRRAELAVAFQLNELKGDCIDIVYARALIDFVD